MYENSRVIVTFLVNLMFRKLDKVDGAIFGERIYVGEHIFRMLIGAHIWAAYKRYFTVYSSW